MNLYVCNSEKCTNGTKRFHLYTLRVKLTLKQEDYQGTPILVNLLTKATVETDTFRPTWSSSGSMSQEANQSVRIVRIQKEQISWTSEKR